MKKEYIVLIGIAFCSLISLLFVSVYKYENDKLQIIGNQKDYEPGDDIYSYYIDGVSYTPTQCIIEGWCAKIGENLGNVDRKLVLLDSVGNVYGLNTVKVNTESVTQYYNDGFNYNNAGLKAKFNLENINKNAEYLLGILVKDTNSEESLINTGIIINNNITQ